MKTTISKEYHFSAAHHLPKVPTGHPCGRLHGHNYIVAVEVTGVIEDDGFCNGVDFYKIDEFVKPLIEKLDHENLNDFIDNPTAELIAFWFLCKCPFLSAVTVWETPKCFARVEQ